MLPVGFAEDWMAVQPGFTAAAPAASSGLLTGIMGGASGLISGLAGPIGIGASLLGGSGMFGGGGMDSSSATASSSYQSGDFIVGSDKTSNLFLIGVIVLLIVLLARR